MGEDQGRNDLGRDRIFRAQWSSYVMDMAGRERICVLWRIEGNSGRPPPPLCFSAFHTPFLRRMEVETDVGHADMQYQLHIESRAEKHNPTYFITARYHERGFPSNSHTIELRSPFARWFDGEGHFVATHFQSWLATGIPVVGSADSSRVLPQASSDEKVRKGDLTAVNAGLENSPKTSQPARKRGVGGKR